MVRIRQAGWLVGIPPLGLGLQFLRLVDIDSVTGSITRNFLTTNFTFWTDDLPSDFKPRQFLTLALFLASAVVALVAVAFGRARTAVIVVSAIQAVIAFAGLVWDFTRGRDLPEFLLHVVPAAGGRATSFFFLAFALIALGLALSSTENRTTMTTTF
jgi:hypothetical protein